MTREEAIAIIYNEKVCVNRASKNDFCNRDCYNCELVKTDAEILTALDMAIKALEQEPCEDAISRQAVLDCLTATKLKKFDFILRAREEIKKLPPVTPQSKTGHWIEMPIGFKCSNCNELEDITTKYCPNCGAKMVEEPDVMIYPQVPGITPIVVKPQESEG